MMGRTNPASPAIRELEVSIFQKFRKSVGLETVSLAITRKKDFSRISNPSVPIFLRIILPSEKQKLQKFKRLVLVEFRMLFAEQFFLHFSHAVPGEFGNRQDPFGKFERCELRAQMLQDEFFTESIMI